MSLIAYIEVGQSRWMHQRHLERSQVFYIQCKEWNLKPTTPAVTEDELRRTQNQIKNFEFSS